MGRYICAAVLLALIVIEGRADPQTDRIVFIQRMTSNAIFLSTSIDEGIPRLVVSPDFYDSDLESKQTAVGIVYQYYLELDSAYDTLVIIDGSTGAQIGTFTAEGLQL